MANPKILTPELVTHPGYTTTQSDLYQLGLLLYQMHTASPRWNAPYPDIARNIAEGTPRQIGRVPWAPR